MIKLTIDNNNCTELKLNDHETVELFIEDIQKTFKFDFEFVEKKNNRATYFYTIYTKNGPIKKLIEIPCIDNKMETSSIAISAITTDSKKIDIDFELKETGISHDYVKNQKIEDTSVIYSPLTFLLNIDDNDNVEFLEYANPYDEDFTFQCHFELI